MKCREFRKNHVGFVDDLLSAAEMESMRAHVGQCSTCGQLNVRIRRSLLVVHNLPRIEPSADFMSRLNARLIEERDRDDPPESHLTTILSIGAFAALAAGLAVTGYLAAAVPTPQQQESLAAWEESSTPMVAVAPESSPIAEAARIYPGPGRADIWPALFLVDQGPIQFSGDGFAQSSDRP